MKKVEKKGKKLNIVRRIRPSTLLILIVLLTFNTYAWFIYATKVSSGISAHISSWNVHFQAGQQVITTQVVFDIENIYPGMPDATKTLTAYNEGEMLAILSYNIRSIRILNTTYTPSASYTQDQILYDIGRHWPFTLTFTIDNQHLLEENGSANFTIQLVWPFETGDDARDTRSWNGCIYI